MILKGDNKLILNQETLRSMVEDSLNASQLDGEDYIYVRKVEFQFVGNTFELTITTDRPTMEVTHVES